MKKKVILTIGATFIFILWVLVQPFESSIPKNNMGTPQFHAQMTTPLVPSSIKVLVVSRASYYGTGYLLSDLARYGFNVTWHYADSGTNYVTGPKTSNINQYDVVILHQTYTTAYQPAAVTQEEVWHFTKKFGGVLILTGNSLMKNQTSGAWFSFTSTPMQWIEQRLGVDFTDWANNPYKSNGTYYKVSSLISDLPNSIPFKTPSTTDYYHTSLTLNGATELYNITRAGTQNLLKGITYYKNSTGAVGIYINGIYEYKTEPQTNVPYYWGLFGGTYQEMTAMNIGLRAGLLGRLISYALGKDYTTVIKPQPMAVFRVDDYVAGLSGNYVNDANQTQSLQYLYNVLTEYNATASLGFLTNTFSAFPNTIQKAKDLKLQDIGWDLSTHFRHEDYRAYAVAQVETLIQSQFSDYSTYGFEKFSVGIAPAGYYANNVYTAMANKGLYLLDLTEPLPSGWEWWNVFVNNTVIIKGAFNMAGSAVLFTAKSKDSIHYTYYSQRPKFSLAIINSAPTFYFHVQNPAMNQVGTWVVRTSYWNLTAEIPDVKFLTNQIFAQYFGKKWATISNPSKSGSTIAFTVNVDNVPTVATIGKGMLWYRITSGSTIQSVKINGVNWYAFDDYTIRIPAQNSIIEVTLGTSTTPYIKQSDKKITATSYEGSKLTFSVDSLPGTVSRTKVYVGDKGKPITVSGADSWSYDEATKIVKLTKLHASEATITLYWNTAPCPLEQAVSRRQSIRVYTNENVSSPQLLGLLQAAYGFSNGHRNIPRIGQDYSIVIFPVNATASYRYALRPHDYFT